MFIRTNPGAKCIRSQPQNAVVVTSEKKQGRQCTIITNLSASVDFYFMLGEGAAAGTAGGGGIWAFRIKVGDPAAVIDNWTGVITCDPVPGEGDLNIAEVMGSNYGTT